MRGRALLVLAAGGLVLFVALGTRQGFGLYLAPMSAELGWGREVFSIAIGLQNLLWGLTQPFAGMIADRYGPARVIGIGGLVYGLGLYLMGTTRTELDLYLGGGLVIGVALSAVSFAVVFGAVARVVPEERRGLALGLAGAGGSAGQFVMVLGTQSLIGAYGWSDALLLGIIGAGVMAAMALPFAARGRAQSAETPVAHQPLRAALAEAFRHRGYWLLNAGFFVCGFHVTFIMTHLPATVTDAGLPAWVAGMALSLIGAFNIIGSFACGSLGDRYRKKHLLSLLYLGRAGVITAFLLVPLSATSVLVFAGAIGLLWLGTVPLTSSLVAQIFGLRYMATLFGIVFLSHQVGAFLGVWLGGKLYDLTGSYTYVWAIAVALGLIAAVLHWPIADRPIARPAGQPAAP
jgi:MFS family permease